MKRKTSHSKKFNFAHLASKQREIEILNQHQARIAAILQGPPPKEKTSTAVVAHAVQHGRQTPLRPARTLFTALAIGWGLVLLLLSGCGTKDATLKFVEMPAQYLPLIVPGKTGTVPTRCPGDTIYYERTVECPDGTTVTVRDTFERRDTLVHTQWQTNDSLIYVHVPPQTVPLQEQPAPAKTEPEKPSRFSAWLDSTLLYTGVATWAFLIIKGTIRLVAFAVRNTTPVKFL